MRTQSARIVLSLFIMSVSLVQLIELGHSLLHRVENPFHYHKISKHKDFKDHSLVDHHFPEMKFAHEMDEPQPTNNFIAIAFGFFQPSFEHEFSYCKDNQIHFTCIIERSYLFIACPPTPPPLG